MYDKHTEERERQEAEEMARRCVVGVKVYRAGYDKIEEGVVKKVSRCNFLSNGNAVEAADGKFPRYWAFFERDVNTWSGQTYQIEWFLDLARARKDLVREVEKRVEGLQRDIAKWEKLIENLSSTFVDYQEAKKKTAEAGR